MVFLKITDGIETRKFQVTAGEITFQELQEKIVSLFPVTAQAVSNLALRYHDSDGDIVTLSSDEELQELLLDLPSDHVRKLHIHMLPSVVPTRVSLLDHLLQSSFRVSRYPWSEFDRQLKEIRGKMGYVPFDNRTSVSGKATTEGVRSCAPEESSAGEEEVTKPREATPDEEEVNTTGRSEDSSSRCCLVYCRRNCSQGFYRDKKSL